MATNNDKCRGSCFYDAPNGPPTPGSPLPLFSIPFSSVGKVRARPIEPISLRIWGGARSRDVGSGWARTAVSGPTSLMRGEGHPGVLFRVVEGKDGVAKVMVVKE